MGKPGIEKLLALSDSGVAKDLDRVVEVFQAARSRAAYEALPGLLKNYHLTPDQRAALMRSFNNYLLDPPISLEPVADYLLTLPKAPPKGSEVPPKLAKELAALTPVKLAALEVLSTGGAWRRGAGWRQPMHRRRDSSPSPSWTRPTKPCDWNPSRSWARCPTGPSWWAGAFLTRSCHASCCRKSPTRCACTPAKTRSWR